MLDFAGRGIQFHPVLSRQYGLGKGDIAGKAAGAKHNIAVIIGGKQIRTNSADNTTDPNIIHTGNHSDQIAGCQETSQSCIAAGANIDII